mmetsp:Transcript_40764/g.68307  ORF Transcript_40764/g.68307 Transcript_40764/m.68307 type:complete len:129 (-) Transcript_40764:2852-3238(-)
MHVARARGQGEETKRRAAAMMLSRTGWDETPLPVARQTVGAGGHHGDVPRGRPTGGPHLLLLLRGCMCVTQSCMMQKPAPTGTTKNACTGFTVQKIIYGTAPVSGGCKKEANLAAVLFQGSILRCARR